MGINKICMGSVNIHMGSINICMESVDKYTGSVNSVAVYVRDGAELKGLLRGFCLQNFTVRILRVWGYLIYRSL